REAYTVTLLPSGKVLVAGGINPSGRFTVFASAEVYDPATGLFSPTGALATARADHSATLLPSGKVLVAGGFNCPRGDDFLFPHIRLAAAEIYTPLPLLCCKDFNGDGQADILWRHTSGTVYEWLLNGTSLIGLGSPGTAGTDWQIQ